MFIMTIVVLMVTLIAVSPLTAQADQPDGTPTHPRMPNTRNVAGIPPAMTLSTMVPATLSMVLPNESIGVNDAANWLNDNAEFQNTCVTCNSMFGMMVRTVALICRSQQITGRIFFPNSSDAEDVTHTHWVAFV